MLLLCKDRARGAENAILYPDHSRMNVSNAANHIFKVRFE